MKIGRAGINLVKAFESCMKAIPGRPGYFKAYLDPVGVLTIGWGHTNHHQPRFNSSTIWSQQDCDDALARDLRIFENAVTRLVKVPLKQHQFDALVSFAYNLGEGNLSKSNLLRKLNRGDYAGAAKEFTNWVRAGGRVLPGLVRRRKSEALMFQGIADLNYDGKPDPGSARRPDPPPKSVAPSAAATGAGTVTTGALEQVQDATMQISPLADTIEIVKYVVLALTLVAAGFMFYRLYKSWKANR